MLLYYAIFSFEDETVNVVFPDLDNAVTFGTDMHDALYMARDLLAGWLLDAEDNGDRLPTASEPSIFSAGNSQLIIPIEVDLNFFRNKFNSKPVKKTLTIPSYLNDLGIKSGINFSQTLTEALKEKLGV